MTKTMRSTAMAVLLSFSSSFIVAPVHAAIVSTEEAVVMHQQQDRSELKQFFDREDIAKALQARGVSPEAAKARVDSMTEEEAQKLAAHIENAPAGAGVLGILFTVFIVLLVTDILGLTKVFPFTRSVR
ncbi:MAG: PA2779 family protein [Limnobacter sp.]|uniref:PA2779 family protein n=1 Tax=Limnobacter sp. TaxID=2003368 RepID=UPI0032EDB3BA